MAHIPLKDDFSETRLFIGRTLVAGTAVALALAALIGRLGYLQLVSHQHFTTLSQENRVRLVALPPARGLVYDREGRLLAENEPTYRLEVTPEEVDDLEGTLDRLAGVVDITPVDRRRFDDLLQRQRPFRPIPVRFRLGPDEVARFAVNRHRFPGVDIEAYLTRHYPHAPLTAHAVGYVGRINEHELRSVEAAQYSPTSHIGKVGIERQYETLLHGRSGYQQVETNAQGRVLRVLERTSPQPGRDLHLTLDLGIQQLAAASLGERRGAIVALDAKTGGVLALVSQPSFDPNAFVNGIEPARYRELRSDPDQPLFNRATRGRYPPGSTIKPFMALAGLDLGVVRPRNETYCPGYYRLPGRSRLYRDWKREGHGDMDLTEAIAQSCDVYFYTLAHELGIRPLHQFLSRFPLGSETGIDLPGERAGLVPSPEWKRGKYGEAWFPGETVIAGIGQGYFLTTPLGLASATAALARRGQPVQPHLLHAVEPREGEAPEIYDPPAPAPIELGQPRHWETVIDGMVDVVHGERGTARAVGHGIEGYRMAGKTGTAQVVGIAQGEEYDEEALAKRLRDHALFIAFAPVDDPEIAVAVLVENAGSGSTAAAPIARRIIDAYLRDEEPTVARDAPRSVGDQRRGRGDAEGAE